MRQKSFTSLASSVFTSAEIDVLDQIDASRPAPRLRDRTLATYLLQMAMLDCYARRSPQRHHIRHPERWSYGAD
jgi:hypothetical protein